MAIDADIEDYFREQHINTSTHTTASTRNTLLQLDRAHTLSYTQSFLATQSGESLSTYYLDIHAPLSDGSAVKDGDVPGKDGTAEDKQTAPDADTATEHETPDLLKSRVATRLWFMDSGGGVLPLSVTGEQLDWLTDTAESLAERAHEGRPGEASINRRSTNAHPKSTGSSAHAKVQVAQDSRRQIDGHVPGFLFVHAPPPEVMQCHCSRTSPSPSPNQNVARSRSSIYRTGLSKSVGGRDLSATSTSAASNSTCFGTREDSIDPFSVGYQTGDSRYKNGIESNISLFGATIADAGIKLVAFGHNHGNDFCCSATIDGQEQHKDSMSTRQLGLCFGRHSGYGGYGEKRWAKGARVYELDLSVTHVATHVRLEDGTIVSQGVVPNFFSDAGISNTQGEGNANPHAHRHEHGNKPSYVTPVVMFGLMIVSSMIVAVWLRWNVRSSRNRKPEEIEQLPMARIAPRPLISDSVTSDVLDSDRLLSSD
ncbi:hypothetical protein SARC_00178 [Sphaeroforma arctica JP610]|uniref:Calcineurin-like phosphoesterase domain-containing protein n=1 Tax=Sphaeroforma arctica JP610 TaxID=667725 RepID=A0A0L0GFW4_9EUKA|nr:hypothetical protein SARC_00178 [Sphaeroforma arctica JP610]KNC87744.1 hypothetical protein SARC_00178 [Sphaeroforma arctica JP610]|eukprot:XP_014161646.1 hypothetical protein SARC_00178 [Sphaeroforma arctica JP610]